MWRAGIRDCHSVQCSLVIDTQPCLLTYYLKAGLKLSDSCCCNSSVHCSTGPQQNVDDDMLGKGSRGEGYSYNKGPPPTFFLNRGPARSKSGPVHWRAPLWYTTQHRTVLITFCLIHQTIITAQMPSTRGESDLTVASHLSPGRPSKLIPTNKHQAPI